jgi:hypothetical protein
MRRITLLDGAVFPFQEEFCYVELGRYDMDLGISVPSISL